MTQKVPIIFFITIPTDLLIMFGSPFADIIRGASVGDGDYENTTPEPDYNPSDSINAATERQQHVEHQNRLDALGHQNADSQ